jgi:hypothetical protein
MSTVMLTSSAKAKGRRLQDRVQSVFVNTLCEPLRLAPGDFTTAVMGEVGCDVKLSPAAIQELGDLRIECKNQERLNLWRCWAQTVANADDGTPILIVSRNRHEDLVVMRMDDWMARLTQT